MDYLPTFAVLEFLKVQPNDYKSHLIIFQASFDQ